MRRVVVTGMVGHLRPRVGLADHRGRVPSRATTPCAGMTEWDQYAISTRGLRRPSTGFEPPEHWNRKQLRSMGRVSQLAVRAAELALSDAGLLGDALLQSGEVGVACGSSVGSTADIRRLRADAAHRRLAAAERQFLRAHDAAHDCGEHRHLLRAEGPHHLDLDGLHVGQPGRRLSPTRRSSTVTRLRCSAAAPRSSVRARRWRSTCSTPRAGATTRSGLDAAALRSRSRRPRDRRGRRDAGAGGTRARAGARRPHLRGDRRLRHQLRRHARHPPGRSDDADRDGARAAQCAGLDPGAIGYVERSRHRDRAGRHRRDAGDRRRCSARACRSVRRRATSATRSAHAARSSRCSASR